MTSQPWGGPKEPLEALADQPAPRLTQEVGPGTVREADRAVGGEIEETHRCHVEKVSVAVEGGFQLNAGREQLGILHFQLNLLDFQFVEEPAGVGRAERRAWAGLRFELCFGRAAAGGGIVLGLHRLGAVRFMMRGLVFWAAFPGYSNRIIIQCGGVFFQLEVQSGFGALADEDGSFESADLDVQLAVGRGFQGFEIF